MKKNILIIFTLAFIAFSCTKNVIEHIDSGVNELRGTTEGSQSDYKCQFFQIAESATEDDLETLIIDEGVDFVNIYVKGGDRIDVNNVEPISVAELFENEGISVSELNFDYVEWVEIDGKLKNVAFQVKTNTIVD